VILNTLDTRFLNTNLNIKQVTTTGAKAGDSLAQTVVNTTIQTPLKTNTSTASSQNQQNSTSQNGATQKSTGNVTIQDQTTQTARLEGFAKELTTQKLDGRLGDSSTYNSDGSISSSNTQFSLNNSSPTAKEVQGVVTAASNNGFTATYNTGSQSEYQNLINNGVPATNINYTPIEKNAKQVIGFTITNSSAPTKTERNFFTLPATVPSSGSR